MANIVILGPAHPLRGGGMATFNERLANEFRSLGHQISIYTFSLQYPGFLFPGKTQYSADPPPENLDIRVKVNSINPFNWLSVGNELKQMKPDLLIIRYWMPFMAPCLGSIAAIVRRNVHTKIVAIADNIVPHEKRPGDNWLTRFFISKIHAFLVMSDSVKKDLLGFDVSEDRISLCMHPLYDNYGESVSRHEARKILKLPHDANIVLFFGFIRNYKGLDILIKAFALDRMKNLNVHLLVAGEFYTASEPYFGLAKSHHLEDTIIWHNHFIANDMVKYYFSAADLVVQPYKDATQSGVTQVAYHFEIPMVVTRVGGLPEMVPDGKAGYVAEPNPEAIASAMADYFENDRKDFFVAGLKQEKQRFSWEILASALLSRLSATQNE